MLFVHRKTSNDICYGELGVNPLDVIINCRMLNFWARLITCKRSKLSYIMYCCLCQLYQRGVYSSPWLAQVKYIYINCGMSEVWVSQTVVNPTWFKKSVAIRLKDQWITTWNANLMSKSICSSYNIYKDIYCLEEYLIVLTKLRASNKRLPINVRW